MWVVKLGGSMSRDPLLPQWLELIAQLGGGRIALVCGGGSLADEVRRLQTHWDIEDLPAHNMAMLAMLQVGYLLQSLEPSLVLAHHECDIQPTLRRGRVALWMPHELIKRQADPNTNWEVTSDSIALGLAQRLNAERLIVVKSCEVTPHESLENHVACGVLDRRFATLARRAWLPIDLLRRDQLDTLRSWLLGHDGRQHVSDTFWSGADFESGHSV